MNIHGSCGSGNININGGCSGGSGTTPTDPTTSTSSSCGDDVCINFDQFANGDIDLQFAGFALSGGTAANPLMIFDSSSPTAGVGDLGSPNMACTPAGPGDGVAGAPGLPTQNCVDLKRILIISDNPPAPGAPVPSPTGGVITLDFIENVSNVVVNLLNVTTNGTTVIAYDFDGNLLSTCTVVLSGDNGTISVASAVSEIRQIKITLTGDAAVTDICYKLCPNGARSAVEHICEDWESFVPGDINLTIASGSVTSDNPGTNPAMVFNSTIPTAGDTSLGSPNDACIPPGAGVGVDGAPGTAGENCIDLANILIISEDAESGVPNAAAAGGQFIFNYTVPVVVKEFHFLNAATDGDLIQLYNGAALMAQIDIPNSGANAFDKVATNYPYTVTQVIVEVSGPTGIAKICYETTSTSTSTIIGDDVCLVRTIEDWESYPNGDTNIRNPDFVLSSASTLMIFDANEYPPVTFPAGMDAFGTPHTDFAGPGIGAGGETGSSWANDTALGKILLSSTDGNSEIFDVETAAYTTTIDFNCPVWLETVGILNCVTAAAQIEVFDIDAVSLGVFSIINTGANGYQVININAKGVKQAVVTTSGAITQLTYQHCCGHVDRPDICTKLTTEDFENYQVGERNLVIPNVLITNSLITVDDTTHPMMILDTANAADVDMGTPHDDFAGPGMGSGGEDGKPGENDTALGKVLIVSMDGNSEFPTPNDPMAPVVITWEFDKTVQLNYISFLNAIELGDKIELFDATNTLIDTFDILQLGSNSVQTVFTNTYENASSGARNVKSFKVTTGRDLAITEVQYVECDESDPPPSCLTRHVIDFDEYIEGDINVSIPGLSLSVDTAPAEPLMIFNSTNPTGGQVTLGTPNNISGGGLGMGAGGETGKPGENAVDHGNILIISEDANPATPLAKTDGGVITILFDNPAIFREIIFVDADEMDNTIEFFDVDDNSLGKQYIIRNGINGISTMTFANISNYSNVKKVEITFDGIAGLVEFTYDSCKDDNTKTESILIQGDDMSRTTLTCTNLQGSYLIIAEAALANGACATYMASSAFDGQAGSITRLTSAASADSETIQIEWLPNMKIHMYHDIISATTTTTIPYNVKIITL